MASIISAGTTSGTALNVSADTSGQLQLATGASATTAVTIDTSQNVGIGTTSPSFKLQANSNGSQLLLDNSSAGQFTQINWANTGSTKANAYWDNTNNQFYFGTDVAYPLLFKTNASERMRIDSSGNVLVNTTSVIGVSKQSVAYNGATNWGIGINDTSSTSGSSFIQFQTGGTTRGNITNNANSGVLYNVTSDQRLKENIQDAETASSLIDVLQVRQYDWKENGIHQRYGFIAQELLNVAPEAVYQPNNPEEMMAVDYSKLVPILIKAHQEQQTIINDLKARIETLEGAKL